MKTCLIESTKISRRSFLQALGALTLSGSLAACGGTGKAKSDRLAAGSLAYTPDEVVTVEFSDGGITVSPEDAAGLAVEGTALSVSGAGVYALSGRCADGSQVVLCGGGALTVNALGKNGIKSGTALDDRDASLTIRELTLNIEALVNDAINAEQWLEVESGNLTIAAGEDAIHCDMELNIGAEGTTGPAITVSTCCEGLEGAVLNIHSGNMDITSTDDCLNAANSDLGDYAFEMNISGGTIKAYSSEGDGFDSNGTLTITGGDISVWTANAADNQPLDADGRITISGGTVLAVGGSAGMGFSISASQPYVTFGGGRDSSLSLAGGEAFSIADESGKSVLDSTALCDAAFLFYSSPALTAEGRYSVQSTATATAKTGEADPQFGGNGGPGGSGGQRPDGMTPPDGAPSDGQMPQGQPPQSDGTTPPELPAASSN